MNNDLLTSIYLNQAHIQSYSRRLKSIGDALDLVGSKSLANTLYDIADGIVASADHVVDTYSKSLDRSVQESRAAVGETLKAVMSAEPRT